MTSTSLTTDSDADRGTEHPEQLERPCSDVDGWPGVGQTVLLVIVPFLLVVALRVLIAWSIEGPAITDEMGYMGTARYLTGDGGLVAEGARSAYKIGYSLLIVPAFALASDLSSAFRWVTVTNAVLLGATFLVMRSLVGRVIDGLSPVQRSAAALVGTLTPGTLIYGSTAFSSSARIAALALFLLLLSVALERGEARWWITVGAVGVSTYVIHESALGIVLVTLAVCLLRPAWGRLVDRSERWDVRSWAGLVGAALVWFADRAVDIPGTRYGTGEKGGGLISGAVEDWQGMVATAAGHVWYFSLASFGVVALALAVVVVAPERRRLTSASALWWLTAAAAVGSVFAIVAIGARDGATSRFDITFLVYGRHMEYLAAVLCPIALAVLIRLLPTLRLARTALALGLGVAPYLLAALALRVSRPEMFSQHPYFLNVPATYIPHSMGWWGLGRTTLIGLGGAVVLFVLLRVRWAPALVVLGLVWVSAGSTTVDEFVQRFYDRRGQQHELADLATELLPEGSVVVWDAESGSNLQFVSYDYWLVQLDLQRADVADADALIISTDLNLPERRPGARAVAFEALHPDFGSYFVGLWVVPGALQDELDDRGWLLPEDDPLYGRPVDIRAEHSVEVLDDSIRLEITNLGGSPWTSVDAVKGDGRTLSFVASWDAPDGTVLAEQSIVPTSTVHPGEHLSTELSRPDVPGASLRIQARFAGVPVAPPDHLVPTLEEQP